MSVILLPLVACSPPEPAVMVFVAASAADTVEQVGERFESDTGASILVNAAASSVLAQQIVAGADADLFLSANVAWCDYLATRDLVAERVDLLGNRMVLIVPSDRGIGIASPRDLMEESVQRIAVADTDSVPAGQYAKQALIRTDVWSAVESKLLPGGDVRQALVYVERGEADAGIVYATDAALSDRVRIVYAFDSDATDPIVYPLIVTPSGKENAEAMRFFAYLKTRRARVVFVEHGFHVAEN